MWYARILLNRLELHFWRINKCALAMFRTHLIKLICAFLQVHWCEVLYTLNWFGISLRNWFTNPAYAHCNCWVLSGSPYRTPRSESGQGYDFPLYSQCLAQGRMHSRQSQHISWIGHGIMNDWTPTKNCWPPLLLTNLNGQDRAAVVRNGFPSGVNLAESDL